MTTEPAVPPTAFAEPATASQAIVLVEEVSSNLPSVPGAMEIQSPDAINPVRPQHLSDERDTEIRAQAATVVAAILKDPSDISITAAVYGLGQEAEASNSQNVSLVDEKIGPVMKEIGTESKLGQSLSQIKASLDLVNPHVVGQTKMSFTDAVTKPVLWGALGSRVVKEVVSRLPVGGTEVMTIINERSDSIRDTITTLKGHLLEERDKALKNAIELGQVANHLADTQANIQEAAYLGQLIWQGLSDGLAKEADPVRKQALMYLVNDIATRVVDLQTIDQLNIQSRMGAETLINNCRGIQTLVGRVTNVLLPSVMTALAVKAAGAQQASLAAHAKAIGHAAGETIAQTAGEIGRVSVDIAKMNTEALIDLNKLEEAAASYERMQQELDTVVREAERNARGITNRMSALNERMRERADPLTAARRAKEAAGV
jgi:uncharacterized protein YaaN involved in tellurite resistance